MSDYEYLIPKEGVLVRDPITYQILPKEGMVKPLVKKEGRYWRRRINDGDVFIKVEKPPIVESELRKKVK